MNNSEYLYSIGVVDADTHEKCREAMDKYGDNHWWEEGQPVQALAYFQLHEELSLVEKFERFKDAIAETIGHGDWVFPQDVADEIDQAYEVWKEQA